MTHQEGREKDGVVFVVETPRSFVKINFLLIRQRNEINFNNFQ